jgi:hypothetical protein
LMHASTLILSTRSVLFMRASLIQNRAEDQLCRELSGELLQQLVVDLG